jgi:hypothetical protein
MQSNDDALPAEAAAVRAGTPHDGAEARGAEQQNPDGGFHRTNR